MQNPETIENRAMGQRFGRNVPLLLREFLRFLARLVAHGPASARLK